jgi:alanine racemase
MTKFNNTKITINSDNLNHNIQSFRKLTNFKTEIGAVVKSNAYGHGLTEVLQAIKKNVNLIFIYDLGELKEARKIFHKEIFLLGPITPQDLAEVINLEPIISLSRPYQLAYFEEICRTLGRKIRVHVAIDTGFTREGVLLEELSQVAERIKSCRHIILEGVHSHFSSADEDADLKITYKQLSTFQEGVSILMEQGFKNLKKHIAATAGSLRLKEELRDHYCIRLGIGLYGLWPAKEMAFSFDPNLLKPVLSLVSYVAETKNISAGQPVGYNQTFTARNNSRLALIPTGYGFGISRKLSNKGEVLIAGERFPIVGRVSMNSIMVDITKFMGIEEGDEVVIIGKDGANEITVQAHADFAETSVYEVATRFPKDLVREIVKR